MFVFVMHMFEGFGPPGSNDNFHGYYHVLRLNTSLELRYAAACPSLSPWYPFCLMKTLVLIMQMHIHWNFPHLYSTHICIPAISWPVDFCILDRTSIIDVV